jgi:hypothetical protein
MTSRCQVLLRLFEIKCTEEARSMNLTRFFINGFADSDSRPPGIEQNRMCEIVSRDLSGYNHGIPCFMRQTSRFLKVLKLQIQALIVFP